ncbi:MAG TPA: type II toxin-antitoxin system HigB family toxin [Chitinophagaceae bacterium]|nr:type II toxin-antitoxin system HigB family toxin [Chitinophagaceae bacterium]
MKIHLIRKKTIEEFARKNVQSRSSLEKWLPRIKDADWNNPADIQDNFGKADLLGQGSNRVIFDIAGNNYRMICKYAFGDKQVHLFICWMGTHAEYDKLCNKNEQYIIHIY